MTKILIKNGKIWDGEKFFFSDIYVENGKIVTIAEKIEMSADFSYDATGQIVSAGFVDSHLHMRKMSSDGLGVGDWACFPFGVTSAVDAWMEQKDKTATAGADGNSSCRAVRGAWTFVRLRTKST